MPRVAISTDDWRRVLGVDIDTAEQSLSDRHEIQAWLDGLSQTFLSYLAFGHADRVVTQSMGRAQLSEQLFYRHLGGLDDGRLRLAYLVHRYLWGRRQQALKKATSIITKQIGSARPLDGLHQSETHLVVAMDAAVKAPQSLIIYALFDRAERVRFRHFSLRKRPDQDIAAHLDRLDRDAIDRVLRKFYGLHDAARCVQRLLMHDGALWLFILRRGKRDTLLTYEGYTHVNAAEWIIAEISAQATHLRVHTPQDEGIRIVESIFYNLFGIALVYEELV